MDNSKMCPFCGGKTFTYYGVSRVIVYVICKKCLRTVEILRVDNGGVLRVIEKRFDYAKEADKTGRSTLRNGRDDT